MFKKVLILTSISLSTSAICTDKGNITEEIVSPAQIYKVSKSRTELATTVTQATHPDTNVSSQQVAISSFAAKGGAVFGVSGKHQTFEVADIANGYGQANELSVMGAYTFHDILTVGLRGEFGNFHKHVFDLSSVSEYQGYYDDRSYSSYQVGLAVHQKGFELGLTYKPKYEQNGLLLREEVLAHGSFALSDSLDIGLVARAEPTYKGQKKYDLTAFTDYRQTDSFTIRPALSYYKVDPDGKNTRAYEASLGAYYDISNVTLGAKVSYRLSDPNDDLRKSDFKQSSAMASIAYRL